MKQFDLDQLILGWAARMAGQGTPVRQPCQDHAAGAHRALLGDSASEALEITVAQNPNEMR